jgi:plastocyanin
MGLTRVVLFKAVVATMMLAVLSALPACSSTPGTTPSSTTPGTKTTLVSGTVTVSLVAQNTAFNKSTIIVPAGASVTIDFNNKDGVPHNFSLYANSSATPPALFQGPAIAGPATTTYEFIAPSKPGTYFFRCDIHPTQMTGSFVVQ